MKKLKLKKKVKVITTLLSFGMLLTVLPSMKLVAEDDTTTVEQTNEKNSESLYDQLITTSSSSEVDSITSNYSDNELTAFCSGLSDEESNALSDHLSSLYENENVTQEIPETVVFTEAGPFMSPVNVSAKRRLAKAKSLSEKSTDGLVLNKTVSATDDPNKFTVSLEAYTTGTVTTVSSTVPVDITVVMDQSGSMQYDFNGNQTLNINNSRQAALKNSVINFINSVSDKYSETADHRISLVQFSSTGYNGMNEDAEVISGFKNVDSNGKVELINDINSLTDYPEGATRIDAGLSKAVDLLDTNYSYTGSNTNRQKVVVVFTDGVPTDRSQFEINIANNAIIYSKNLKEKNVTVYSIGIMNGANVNQLYGDNCTGEIGSSWSRGRNGNGDIAAVNRFLNYLSSNFKTSSSLGLTKDWRGNYKISENFPRDYSNYYLAANNSSSLNDIFQTISNQIQSSNIDLGSSTIIKDTVTNYFDIPSDTSDIRVYTAAAKSDGTFENKVLDTSLTPVIDSENNSVSVNGFNFNDNFVSTTEKKDKTYGKKLIVEFEVTRKSEFIGGNDVPTNVWNSSGVYTDDGTEVKKFADETTTPKVNVPITDPVFTVYDKTIYQGGSLDGSKLFNVPNTSGWQYDYVDVVRSDISDVIKPDDCNDYSLTLSYKPKTDGSASSCGVVNDKNGKSITKVSHVHVLKSILTVNASDTYKYYGESYILGDKSNTTKKLEWKDLKESHNKIPQADGSAPYGSDDISLSYRLADNDDNKDITVDSDNSIVMPKKDVVVKIVPKLNGNTLNDVTFVTNCNIDDHNCENRTNGTYIVHYKTCSLKIHKSGGTVNEPYVFNVSNEIGKYFSITVTPTSTDDKDVSRDVTISELPVGSYTIEEDSSMSWRYTSELSKSNVSLSSKTPNDSIICTNTKKDNNQWFSKITAVVSNIFDGTEYHTYDNNSSNTNN